MDNPCHEFYTSLIEMIVHLFRIYNNGQVINNGLVFERNGWGNNNFRNEGNSGW